MSAIFIKKSNHLVGYFDTFYILLMVLTRVKYFQVKKYLSKRILWAEISNN